MELRHLQALVAVAEHGSFSSAADHLGTVQSNISAHVARLERELGTTLVDRSAGRLTADGEWLESPRHGPVMLTVWPLGCATTHMKFDEDPLGSKRKQEGFRTKIGALD